MFTYLRKKSCCIYSLSSLILSSRKAIVPGELKITKMTFFFGTNLIEVKQRRSIKTFTFQCNLHLGQSVLNTDWMQITSADVSIIHLPHFLFYYFFAIERTAGVHGGQELFVSWQELFVLFFSDFPFFFFYQCLPMKNQKHWFSPN